MDAWACRVDVGPGQLPECFEGEERTDPGIGDLLHLVSGRQLLGVVRELKTHLIPGALTRRCARYSKHS